jgi:hypothetical protein
MTSSHFVTVPQLVRVNTLVYVHILPLAQTYRSASTSFATCKAMRFAPALSSCQDNRALVR